MLLYITGSLLILIINWVSSDEAALKRIHGCYGQLITLGCKESNHRILIQRIVAGIDDSSSPLEECESHKNDTCRFDTGSSELNEDALKKLNNISESIQDKCNGNHKCEIHIGWIQTTCDGNPLATTEYLEITYNCIEVRNGFILPNVSSAKLTSPVDLYSTGYPENNPFGDRNISCGIELFSESQPVNVRVEVMYITFPRRNVNSCAESFQIHWEERSKIAMDVCSDPVESFISTGGMILDEDVVSHPSLTLKYTTSLKSPEIGGKFWIRISVSDDSSMKISCDEKEDQDLSTESDEMFISTEQTIVTTQETVNNITDVPLSSSERDRDSKNIAVMAGAIVGTIGILMIILVLVVFLIQQSRKRPAFINDSEGGNDYYNVPPKIDKSKAIENHITDDHKIKNADVMYATIDRSKKKNVRKSVNNDKEAEDDVIMCENEDLYESASIVNNAPIKGENQYSGSTKENNVYQNI